MKEEYKPRGFKTHEFQLKTTEDYTQIYKNVSKSSHLIECTVEPFNYDLSYQAGIYDFKLVINFNKANAIESELKKGKGDRVYVGFTEALNEGRAIKTLFTEDYELLYISIYDEGINPNWNDKNFSNLHYGK